MPLYGDEKREYQRNWLAARRAEFFSDKCCVGCGSTDQLELDHLDPSKKITHRVWSWSAVRRDAEIAKCQVLCFHCHKAKSISQMTMTQGVKPYSHGTRNMYNTHGCRCGLCVLWNRNRVRRLRAERVEVVEDDVLAWAA